MRLISLQIIKTPERGVYKTEQNYNVLLQNEPKDIKEII